MALNDAVPSSAADVFKRNVEDIDRLVNSTGNVTTRTDKIIPTWDEITKTHAAWNNRGEWVTSTLYAVNDIWKSGSNWYVVLTGYTSGATVNDDIAGPNVTVLQGEKYGTFEGLSDAVDFVIANPELFPENTALSTTSYRTKAECTTLGIAYPDGGGAAYVVVPSGTGVDNGVSFIDSGTVQLMLNIKDGAVVDAAVSGAIPVSGVDSHSAIQSLVDFMEGATVTFSALYDIHAPLTIPVLGVALKSLGANFGMMTTSIPTAEGEGYRLIRAIGASNFEIDGLFLDTTTFAAPTTTRLMHLFGCTNYTIKNCTVKTAGAFTASLNCNNYTIKDNSISISAADNVARHDGVIDQWFGSHTFTIKDNKINGGGIGKYGILVTGTDTDAMPTNSFDFSIRHNTVTNFRLIGIQAHGRTGDMYGFNISDNTVSDITEFHGIQAQDCRDGYVENNFIRRTSKNALGLKNEGGGFAGIISAKNIIASGNIILDANTGVNTGDDGAAIVVNGDSEGNIINNNIVRGLNHTYALIAKQDTLNNTIGVNHFAEGTSGVVLNQSLKNRLESGDYIPASSSLVNVNTISVLRASYTSKGDFITVTGSVNVSAASAGTVTFNLSLPVFTTFDGTNIDVIGGITATNLSGIVSQSGTNLAELKLTAPGTGVNIIKYSYTFKVYS